MMHSILLLFLVRSSISSSILIADVPVNLPTDSPVTQQSTQTKDPSGELIDSPVVFDPLEANATTETPPPETFPPIVIAGEISKREVDVEGSGNSSMLPENLSFSDFQRLEEKEEDQQEEKKAKPSFEHLSKIKGTSGFDDNLFDDVPYVK
ncbi:hypothetical protein M3Y98_00685800 [Aphelenchoides besseyi]|nr:hypothetical protein M3Y98_00685800 [Aphelenchoides besseyi]KAI6209040.1 hypothetical protein M3Y96_00179000 [Aphelenchoides besseyi]